MYSRKFALTLAKQYRTCPPSEVRNDPSQRLEYDRHLAICPYCSMQKREEHDAWIDLSSKIEDLLWEARSYKEEEVCPGQFRFLRKELCRWRDGLFYNPPLVLILENTGVISDDVLVAQIYHDISLAGPGDLILMDTHTPAGDLFVESWNIYTLKASDLGVSLGSIPPEIINTIKALEKEPDAYPDWTVLPRPLTVNDPRIYFRELEIEVGYTFAVSSVSELMEEAETPRLRLVYASASEVKDALCNIVSGTRWQREPMTREEALALAEFPPEQIPLAAGDETEEKKTANLILIKDGVIQAIDPVGLKIYHQIGALTLSGRILGLPDKLENSDLVFFLDISGQKPVPPVKYEWKEETGDFLLEFKLEEGLKGKLKAAVVSETIRD